MLPPLPLPPLLARVVASGLHVLPSDPQALLAACSHQLSRPEVNRYIRRLRARERGLRLLPDDSTRPLVPEDGAFGLLPRELVLSILTLLDLSSLVMVSSCSTTLRQLCMDPMLYSTVDLRQVGTSTGHV